MPTPTMMKRCRGESRHGDKIVPCPRAALEQGLCARHLAGARKSRRALDRKQTEQTA